MEGERGGFIWAVIIPLYIAYDIRFVSPTGHCYYVLQMPLSDTSYTAMRNAFSRGWQ